MARACIFYLDDNFEKCENEYQEYFYKSFINLEKEWKEEVEAVLQQPIFV